MATDSTRRTSKDDVAAHPGEASPGKGTATPGAGLEQRQDRNSKLTEQHQDQPGGKAHSDKPDPTNP